jgi:hypothetical protein
MWVGMGLRFARFIPRALHTERAIAVIELLDEFIGHVWNTNRAYDFRPLDDDAIWSISFASRR